MHYKNVIVAVSLEDETIKPLNGLKKMNFSADAEIHLVHLVPIILYARGMNLSVLTYPLPEERPAIEAEIIKKLKAVGSELLPGHTKFKYKCLFDSNIKAAFVDYTKDQKGDLVVVATRSRHGLAGLFDSSFAQHQLKHAPVSVHVLR